VNGGGDHVGGERLRRRRLRSQLLSGPPADSPDAVVGHLLAVQAQDGRGFRLAVRGRSRSLTAPDVDAALDDGRLVVTWLNRGTLHLVRAEDYWWLQRLTAHRVLPGVQTRLRGLGVGPRDEERGVDVVADALALEGPLTRLQLRDRLDAAGVATAGRALIHLLAAASLRGLVARGPLVDGHHAFVSVGSWLGRAPAGGDHDGDLDRLARRYLAGHGPATPADLAGWAGVTLGDARRAFDGIGGDLREMEGGAVPADSPPRATAPPRARLLGPFDPVLHGWASRAPFVGAHASVVTANGIFRASCLVGGRVVGTWTLPRTGPVLDLMEPVDASGRNALVADARDVVRFLGHAGGPATFTGHTGDPAR
jgi:hypothetical protein